MIHLEANVIFNGGKDKKSNLVLLPDNTSKKTVIKTSRPLSPEDFDFKELFTANYSLVLKHALFLTGDKNQAEDIAQETFIKLYEQPPKEFTNLSAWLLTVATNITYNNWRSSKNQKRRETEGAMVGEIFEEDFDRLSDIEQVRELLARLDDRDRICLVLKFSGFTYDEIAEITGVNKSSVGKVISRAIAKFKKVYTKEMA
jgi:RNA polymerase sigma factor (sigma-70 family)